MKTIKQKLNDIFFKREKEKLLNPNKFIKLGKFYKFILGSSNCFFNFIVASVLSLMPMLVISLSAVKKGLPDEWAFYSNLTVFLLIFSTLNLTIMWIRKKNNKKLRKNIEEENFDYLNNRLFSGKDRDISSMDFSITYDSKKFKEMVEEMKMSQEDIENFKKELLKEFNHEEITKALTSESLNGEFKNQKGFSYFYFYKLIEILKENKDNKKDFDLQYKALISDNFKEVVKKDVMKKENVGVH